MEDDQRLTPITAGDAPATGWDITVMGGREVRAGSAAAFVASARVFEAAIPDDPGQDATLAQLGQLLPVLRAVRVREVFSLRSSTRSEALRSDRGPLEWTRNEEIPDHDTRGPGR